MSETLDMATLARFAILPGAGALMKAFSEIPPGPLRDSVIQHAQVIAATYTGAPAAHRMPDPLANITPGRKAQVALPTRTGRAPPIGDDLQTQAVQMRMSGATVPEIIAATGLNKQQIYSAVYAARKAGLKIPRIIGTTAEPGSKRWITSPDDISPQGVAPLESAAHRRGISVQGYLDRRQLALKMAQEGAGYERILAATGERDSKVVSAWLSAARAAGHKVPYVTFISVHDAAPPPVNPPELATGAGEATA